MSKILQSKLTRTLAKIIGNFLILLLPKKAKKLSENRITLVHMNKQKLNVAERLMRFALVEKLEPIEDHKKIADLNRKFWENKKAVELFLETEDKFKTDFLPNSTFIFDLLKEKLSNQPEKFNTLVEIGTGNGDILNYLSSKLPQINRFIGIDLSAHQIELNTKKFKNNQKLEFVTADVCDWIKLHGHKNMIFVTYSGVLEYFLENQLQDFLIDVNHLGEVIFVAIEPNSAGHNFDENPNTQIYGNEPSFSHNYPKLFENAGFSLWHFSQKPYLQSGCVQTYIGANNF